MKRKDLQHFEFSSQLETVVNTASSVYFLREERKQMKKPSSSGLVVGPASPSSNLKNCCRNHRSFSRAGEGMTGGFLRHSLIGTTTTIVLCLLCAVAVIQIVPGPLPVSSFTTGIGITVQVRPSTSCSRLGLDHYDSYPYSYTHGQKENSARGSSKTCLVQVLKRKKSDGPLTLRTLMSKTKSSSKSSTLLNLSRLRNSHNDYIYNDSDSDNDTASSDQMSRRRKRRPRQREEETASNHEVEARRKSRRKSQRYEDYEHNSRNKASPSNDGNRNDNRTVQSVMKRRKQRQRRNNSRSNYSNNNLDSDILSNTVDLSFQAMNGVKYVAKKTASTSKHLLNDLGSEINKRLIDDDDYYRNYVEADENGVQVLKDEW